ncbi:hypothetical protein IUSA1_07865 [Streptococcus iniae IUSA1]|nr:hypothetical protein IUSA1_07865 [Streptococcus iniae IUSA1]
MVFFLSKKKALTKNLICATIVTKERKTITKETKVTL